LRSIIDAHDEELNMRSVFFLLLLTSFGANAVVIRDDVPDLQYRMAISDFPALADLPGEGHGVLIAPQWVVTAAHAVSWQHAVDAVVVGGTPRAVDRVVIHPGYRKAPQEMVDAAMTSGDWEAFFDFIASSDDIALIRLAEPVRDVGPVRIHPSPALGDVVRIMGRGATGNGAKGHSLHGPNRTDLRQGYNAITVSEGRWIGYLFDAPPNALPLEATSGSGDSGGPILVTVDGEWHVAGIAAWKRARVNGTEIQAGRYGETSYGVRLGHYADWIDETTHTPRMSR
jgi:hypothetical protein